MKIVPIADCRAANVNLYVRPSVRLPSLCARSRGITDIDEKEEKGNLYNELGVPLVYLQNATLIGIFFSTNLIGKPSLFVKIDFFTEFIRSELVFEQTVRSTADEPTIPEP